MTLNRTYYHKNFGAVVTFKFEGKLVWVRDGMFNEWLVKPSSLTA